MAYVNDFWLCQYRYDTHKLHHNAKSSPTIREFRYQCLRKTAVYLEKSIQVLKLTIVNCPLDPGITIGIRLNIMLNENNFDQTVG